MMNSLAERFRRWCARRTRATLSVLAGIFILLPLDSAANASERYAIVIANKTYMHTAEVTFADRDADAIEAALTSVWGVRRRNIRRMNNATVGDLRYVFGARETGSSLASSVGRQDSELIVYFAGHGSKEDEKPFLLGVDSRPERLGATGFSLDVLIANLKRFQQAHLKKGRVILVLESCFSGRTHAGELLANASAPAFGAPIVLSARLPKQTGNVLVMSAAQGDQYAAWDPSHRQSIFTDALVSGLFGEADQVAFGGNGDGFVKLGELGAFLKSRVARRLWSVRPGTRQTPEVFGGDTDETLVEVASISSEWNESFRRVHAETLQAAKLLGTPDTARMRTFLSTCLYCPRRKQISDVMRNLKRTTIACEIEAPILENLLKNGTAREVRSFQATCQCCAQKTQLAQYLAGLPQDKSAAEKSRRVAVLPKTPTPGNRVPGGSSGADSGAIAFDKPLAVAAMQLRGLTFEQVLELKPIVSPIAGLPQSAWKQTCSSCHNWKRESLCRSGRTFVMKPELAERHKHPFNGVFKTALKRWAEADCP